MLIETFIDKNNKQINVYEYEEISAFNEAKNTNYEYEEHSDKKFTKEECKKLAKDSLIGFIMINLLTMIVAAFRFAFILKVDKAYLWDYVLEYPKLVFGWILLFWVLWTLAHTIIIVMGDRRTYFEYFTVAQMKALQNRNRRNRTAAYEGMTVDDTSERYKSIRIIGSIDLKKKFKEDKGTDILEIPTDKVNEDGEQIIDRYNIQKGNTKGKTLGYIKVSDDEYVRIVEYNVYPFVITSAATAIIVVSFVTVNIRPVKVNETTGEVKVSKTMEQLEHNFNQEDTEAEMMYLWIPAFASKIQVDADNQYIPLRNYSENRFRDVMWGQAEEFRSLIAENPEAYNREEIYKKCSLNYVTLTATEIENFIRYIYGETDEMLRETYENEFSFQYDVLVDRETAEKMNLEAVEVNEEIAAKYENTDKVCVYTTYPELVQPGAQDLWNVYEAFNVAGEYHAVLSVTPYITETLEQGPRRDVVVTLQVYK